MISEMVFNDNGKLIAVKGKGTPKSIREDFKELMEGLQ